ncbi:ABC-1 domain-containing protein [Solidesulfovibrio carbinoliphilus subsp. oakridgensis]|uniref:ABC-1 domain-containing protein n=1 Tax=Solidesulfovibrio carbinoliphilus subsp. oakridgensis TaxID=694327 RepID=G7Q536_9BACT|nr:AarF/UbiB family protein [Solidesulfovibrio carbinoliphilus]EHJ47963.1 ABC-1 domain-containing protein [Solidesulfovibrio carbinoliphilus subsp. oakridgensis]
MGPVSALRRVWLAFRFLHTVFVLVRRDESFLFMRPQPPRELKETILTLGVSFIKLAQVLATRADFFTEDYLADLRAIHDEVAPMSEADFRASFFRAFGDVPPFAAFDETPLASASIGQVHEAYLTDGTKVAVKLRRLGVASLVRSDIRLMRSMLAVFTPFFSSATKNSIEAVLAEFSAMIVKEADLSVELANLRKFTQAYADRAVRFPVPIPELSNADALVMSFETGLRIDDKAALSEAGIDFQKVLDELIGFYIEQMLVRGYFHADPHPGNILVRPDGGLTLLDFGMVKRLPADTRVAMIEVAKTAHDRDYEGFIVACKRLGIVAAGAKRTEMMEFAERMFDIFGDAGLSAASMQALAFSVMNSMKDLPFKVPQDVVYVMRASTLVEGIGTTYMENFNGIKDILPQLRSNMARAMGAGHGLFPTLQSELASLPLTLRRAKTVLTDLSESNLRVKVSPETIEYTGHRLRPYVRAVATGLLLVAAAFLALLTGSTHAPEIAWTLFGLGALRVWLALR